MTRPSTKQFFFDSRYRMWRHLVFWVLAIAGTVLLYGVYLKDFGWALMTSLVIFPVTIVYTYGLLWWLVPRYLVRQRYGLFLLLFLAWVICGQVLLFLCAQYILVPIATGQTAPSLDGNYTDIFDWFRFIVTNTIATCAVIIKIFKYWYSEQEQRLQMAKEKAEAELQLLKAQLHPHFLFNTLNNLYSLVYEKSEKAPAMLLRVSDLLSYVLYECKADEVPLEKELRVIRDYVALEQERYGERLEISLHFSGDIENRMITPMLFQPFIENAFKHGASEQTERAWMSIDLSVKGDQLAFKMINNCDSDSQTGEGGGNGIGIGNVKKRLELLYPSKFQLHCGRENDLYVVSLMMILN